MVNVRIFVGMSGLHNDNNQMLGALVGDFVLATMVVMAGLAYLSLEVHII